jgi:hypothetical protein
VVTGDFELLHPVLRPLLAVGGAGGVVNTTGMFRVDDGELARGG